MKRRMASSPVSLAMTRIRRLSWRHIFFTSSARRDFSSQEEKQAFRDISLGRYIEKHRSSFFVALKDAGGAVGYLAGCLENPLTLHHFNDVGYFRDIDDLCRDYPA